MSILKLFKRAFSKLQNDGIKKSLIDFMTLLHDYYFDFTHKIDTASWYSIAELAKENPVAKHAVLYQATKVLPLKALFKKIDISENQVFVDIGSGKGRVLILALKLGFKKVKGIEFSSFLCLVAEENIRKCMSRVKLKNHHEIINIDASQYQFKDD